MIQFRKLVTAVVAMAVVLVASSTQAYAGPSCRGDKRLDVPMDFTASVQGSQVHLSASGGADKSGWVAPSVWSLYTASGKRLDYFPQGLLIFVSQDMVTQANVDGLAPGAYTIALTSADFCNNQGTVTHPIEVRAPQPEVNTPRLSTPKLVLVGLQTGQFGQIQFSVTDDTGIEEVAVYISGTKIKEYKYNDGVNVRWWFDDYPQDGTQSVLEGPNYYVNYPTSYQGQYVLVEIEATDVLRNVTKTSAWMVL